MNKIARINFAKYKLDRECIILASLGFSNKLIRSVTGYTDGMISYRLKKIKLKRQDYRDGKSPLSNLVINKARRYSLEYLQTKVKELR